MVIKDVDINYVQYGNQDGEEVVLLHGWGQNIEMMDGIGKGLQDENHITILDLPGFGKTKEPPFGWTIYDYYEMLSELLDKLNIKNPVLVGHSFGGRIAIVYSARKKVKKLVLLAAPYRRNSNKSDFKIKILKTFKKIPLINKLESVVKKNIGSTDYRNASLVMRQVLVNVVNENLYSSVKTIKAPTLLIWGSNDTEAIIEQAREMEAVIPDAGLVVYDGCTHYAYIERLKQTINTIRVFIKGAK